MSIIVECTKCGFKGTEVELHWHECEKEEGKKYDSDKLRFDLIPPEVLEEIAKIITMGAKKYEPNNWQKVSPERYIAALHRHINAWQKGEINDVESGERHLSHALCNLAFLLWKEIHV